MLKQKRVQKKIIEILEFIINIRAVIKKRLERIFRRKSI